MNYVDEDASRHGGRPESDQPTPDRLDPLEQHRDTYDQLAVIFELNEDISDRQCVTTLPSLCLQNVIAEYYPGGVEDPTTRDEALMRTIGYMQGAAMLLQLHGIDPFLPRSAFRNHPDIYDVAARKVAEALNDMSNDDPHYASFYLAQHMQDVLLEHRPSMAFGVKVRRDSDLLDGPIGTALRQEVAYFARTKRNPRGEHDRFVKHLQLIMSEDVTNMVVDYDEARELAAQIAEADHPDEERGLAILEHAETDQQLDFTVLSPDTDIRRYAEDLIATYTEREKAHVDLRRLAVLEEIRDLAGKENCLYAHGKPTGKTMKDKKGRSISEDYIALVIQNHDKQGHVLSEDAVAISPIAQRNAAYVVRGDVSDMTWREILECHKPMARELGARKLAFTRVAGEDPYEPMQEKMVAVLTCEPAKFHEALRRSQDGSYTLYSRRKLARACSVLLVTDNLDPTM